MTKEKAFEIVKASIEEHGYDNDNDIEDPITLATTKEELDLDSLDLVQISIIIEERLDVDFDIPNLSDIKTVGDVVTLVEAYE